jgi:type I restriction enzyme, S subunit
MSRQRATLGELCSLVKGTSPISKTTPGPYPLVTTGEIHKSADTFQLDVEAVCIQLISSTGHGHASIKRVHYQTGKFALANLLAAALVKDSSVLSSKFLTRYLMFNKDRLIAPLMTGVANMSISLDRLATVPIEFPPLAQQERIVELLDQADQLRKLRGQADRRISDLVPAIFNQMFGGKGEGKDKILKLEQVAEVVSGIAKGRKFNGREAIETPYLRVANVQDGYLDLVEIKTILAVPEEITALSLRRGDVLLTEGGDFDKLGRGAMVEQDMPNVVHQNHVFRVRADPNKLESIFFAKYLRTAEAKRYFLRCAKQTTNLASINMRQLRALTVPVPSLSLQRQFARRVAEIREIEDDQEASRQNLESFFQSMLHGAFNGEL